MCLSISLHTQHVVYNDYFLSIFDQMLQFWLKLLDGPLINMIQEGSSVSAPSCSAAVDCLSNIGAVIFNELPVSVELTCLFFSNPTVFLVTVIRPSSSRSFFFQVHKRILCITLLLGFSNDEDKNVKVKFTQLDHRRLFVIKSQYLERQPYQPWLVFMQVFYPNWNLKCRSLWREEKRSTQRKTLVARRESTRNPAQI